MSAALVAPAQSVSVRAVRRFVAPPWLREGVAWVPDERAPAGPLADKLNRGGGVLVQRRVRACLKCLTHDGGQEDVEDFAARHRDCRWHLFAAHVRMPDLDQCRHCELSAQEHGP